MWRRAWHDEWSRADEVGTPGPWGPRLGQRRPNPRSLVCRSRRVCLSVQACYVMAAEVAESVRAGLDAADRDDVYGAQAALAAATSVLGLLEMRASQMSQWDSAVWPALEERPPPPTPTPTTEAPMFGTRAPARPGPGRSAAKMTSSFAALRDALSRQRGAAGAELAHLRPASQQEQNPRTHVSLMNACAASL